MSTTQQAGQTAGGTTPGDLGPPLPKDVESETWEE
jgi:hypothetical protein